MRKQECWHTGKHEGAVKRRRVLRYNGVVRRELYSVAVCDRHYALDLKHAIKRGKTAAGILAKLEA